MRVRIALEVRPSRAGSLGVALLLTSVALGVAAGCGLPGDLLPLAWRTAFATATLALGAPAACLACAPPRRATGATRERLLPGRRVPQRRTVTVPISSGAWLLLPPFQAQERGRAIWRAAGARPPTAWRPPRSLLCAGMPR
jgi:hypothetical protein